jgi:hypothetical protein
MKTSTPESFGVLWDHQSEHPVRGYKMAASNCMPIPYSVLSLQDYLHLAFCRPWGPTGEGLYRQVMDLDPNGKMWEVIFTHYPDYSLAVAKTYRHVDSAPDEFSLQIPEESGPYRYYLRFYRVGCRHTYRELSMKEAVARGVPHWGTFCHVYECTKCGSLHTVDSSG